MFEILGHGRHRQLIATASLGDAEHAVDVLYQLATSTVEGVDGKGILLRRLPSSGSGRQPSPLVLRRLSRAVERRQYLDSRLVRFFKPGGRRLGTTSPRRRQALGTRRGAEDAGRGQARRRAPDAGHGGRHQHVVEDRAGGYGGEALAVQLELGSCLLQLQFFLLQLLLQRVALQTDGQSCVSECQPYQIQTG